MPGHCGYFPVVRKIIVFYGSMNLFRLSRQWKVMYEIGGLTHTARMYLKITFHSLQAFVLEG